MTNIMYGLQKFSKEEKQEVANARRFSKKLKRLQKAKNLLDGRKA